MKTFFGRVIAVVAGIILFFILCFIVFSILEAIFGSGEKIVVENGSVLTIDLEDPLQESDMEVETSIFQFSNKPQPHLLKLLQAIEKAKTDDDIKGISLELDRTDPDELSQLELIRNKIEDFKKSGKFVYAYTNRVNQGDYYLATVADSIFHHPMGNIELKGLAAEVTFFKNLGEKYGVEFEIIRHGKYKSAVEPFLRENLSDENREQLTEIVDQMWAVMSKKMADSRKIPIANFNQTTDSLNGFIANTALSSKLIDVVAQENQYYDFLKKKLNIDQKDELKSVTLVDYANKMIDPYKSDKIAVLYAHGTISAGDGQNGIQSETYKEAIRAIADNEDVKAVVLRVNSGGGDANTSDEILYELKRLHSKVPIYVSFGDVAASGGYYIAMEGDKIFAEPYTITGSIGVLGMIPNGKGFLRNIGITKDHVQTNANSVYYSVFEGLTPHGKEKITENTEYIYSVFVNHVAANRKRNYVEIDSLGGGRIYTGLEAKKLGLVDEIGSLEDVLTYAAKQAKITDYQVKAYPEKKSDLETIMKELNLSTEIKTEIKNSMDPDLLEAYMQIETLKKLNGTQMLWPYDLKIQ